MEAWRARLQSIEAVADLPFDVDLLARMARMPQQTGIHFYTPSFKSYATEELTSCGKHRWPAVSVTGPDCKLACDHCKAKILEPMIPARTPDALWRVVNEQVELGARGMLLTGGSNHRNEIEYEPFYPVVRRIKDAFPEFRVALHTALVDANAAKAMEAAGVDVAMMDVIGSQDTITQVYHLKRTVDDFERSLETLVATRMKVVPHIVIGLHYGELLGEWHALDIVRRQQPDALVLVGVMPQYASAQRPFRVPDPHRVGQFFLDARAALPDLPLLLGCARPAGLSKSLIDSYAVFAGLNGIAHPAEGMVELAARLGRVVRVTPACCSIAVGDEVMALADDTALSLDVREVIAQEKARQSFKGVRIHHG